MMRSSILTVNFDSGAIEFDGGITSFDSENLGFEKVIDHL